VHSFRVKGDGKNTHTAFVLSCLRAYLVGYRDDGRDDLERSTTGLDPFFYDTNNGEENQNIELIFTILFGLASSVQNVHWLLNRFSILITSD
jgi:hypothetical protein